MHANPRASGCVDTSGTGRRTDNARRASGDATASSPIAGRYSRKSTEESHISSCRSSLKSPVPSGAVRAASCAFSPKSEGDTRRETVGPDSHRAPEAWCSRARTLQAQTAETWCFRTGTLQAQIPNTACDGLAPSAFDPSLEYYRECGAVLAAPVLFFAVVPFVVCRRRRVIFLHGAVYDGQKGQAFSRPSRS